MARVVWLIKFGTRTLTLLMDLICWFHYSMSSSPSSLVAQQPTTPSLSTRNSATRGSQLLNQRYQHPVVHVNLHVQVNSKLVFLQLNILDMMKSQIFHITSSTVAVTHTCLYEMIVSLTLSRWYPPPPHITAASTDARDQITPTL